MKTRHFLIAASIVLSGCNSDDRRSPCEIKLPSGAYPKIELIALVNSDGIINILSKQCGLGRMSVFLSFEQRQKLEDEAKYAPNQGMLNDKIVQFDAIVIQKRLGKQLVVYKVENLQPISKIPEWLKPMYTY